MSSIKNFDFSQLINNALEAAKNEVNNPDTWRSLEDIIKNISQGLVADIEFITKKKLSGEFNQDDARVFLEDQKMLARIRIRSIALMTLRIAERIWNAVANIFQGAISTLLGWKLL